MESKENLDLPKLDGNNYQLWKFGVTFALKAKGLTCYIDDTEPEPNKETELEKWKKWDKAISQAAVILIGSVEKSMFPYLINCSTPKQIWDKLAALYADSSEDTKHNAWQQYYDFHIKEGESVALQIEQFENICRKLADANEKLSDASIETKLLSSLPQKFSTFRMAWECTPKAERKKDALIARLIREEKRLSESDENISSLALQIQAFNLKIQPQDSRKNNAEKKQSKKRK